MSRRAECGASGGLAGSARGEMGGVDGGYVDWHQNACVLREAARRPARIQGPQQQVGAIHASACVRGRSLRVRRGVHELVYTGCNCCAQEVGDDVQPDLGYVDQIQDAAPERHRGVECASGYTPHGE